MECATIPYLEDSPIAWLGAERDLGNAGALKRKRGTTHCQQQMIG